jgi:hypothetical protein
MIRTLADLVWSGPRAIAEDHTGGHNDTIMRIIGMRAWSSLPVTVQRRFERTTPAVYDGETDTTMTIIGRFFSLVLLAFGAPMPVLAGKSAAKVYVSVRDGGMSWTRVYRGPAGLTFSVRSIKRLSQDGRLFECCTGGWTMLLDVFADQGSLVFRSCRFFWRHGPVSIALPVWMTPGVAEVRHTDLGDGQFRFTLSFDHPWFGRTLYQDGVFNDPTE